MKNKLFLDMQDRALRACFELHNQLLTEAAYAGYEGTKECFDRLFAEVYIITRDEVPDDANVEQIIDAFHETQLAVMNGDCETDWYLYR